MVIHCHIVNLAIAGTAMVFDGYIFVLTMHKTCRHVLEQRRLGQSGVTQVFLRDGAFFTYIGHLRFWKRLNQYHGQELYTSCTLTFSTCMMLILSSYQYNSVISIFSLLTFGLTLVMFSL